MFPKFIWDPAKARANWHKHRVSLDEAIETFGDPDAVEIGYDVIDGELRVLQLARCRRLLLVVVFTERGSQIRIISARRANRHEYKIYIA